MRGRLTTYQNQLQLDQLQQDIQTCNSNMANQVQPISLELPFASLTGGSTHSPQRYQGMLVKLPQTLTVSENYNYGRYGELSLSLGRLYIPTNLYPALSPEAKALAQKNLSSKIILMTAITIKTVLRGYRQILVLLIRYVQVINLKC